MEGSGDIVTFSGEISQKGLGMIPCGDLIRGFIFFLIFKTFMFFIGIYKIHASILQDYAFLVLYLIWILFESNKKYIFFFR